MAVKGAALLAGLQSELESIYGVEGPAPVERFVIDRARWRRLSSGEAPEELLVVEQDDSVEIGLFLEPALLSRLSRSGEWTTSRLSDHCVAVEGVSHFLYLTSRATVPRPVSHLELELQAEVDKFATVLLRLWADGRQEWSPALRERLFDNISFRPGLSPPVREQYEKANFLARMYCRFLERRYILRNHIDGFLADLRRMYRLGCGEKLSYAACGAAY